MQTNVQERLNALPAEVQERFKEVFGSVDRFYKVVYLITRNEHLTETEKPDRYEDRLQVIRSIRSRVEALVSRYGLDGKEWVADIASDYFEDFIQYREPDMGLSNEEFIGLIQRIASAR